MATETLTNKMSLPEGTRLFIIGDSFSVAPGPGDDTAVWTRIAAQELARRTGEPVSIVNASIMGASQDWCWMTLHGWIESGILRPQDYLIIAMTHPGRFWYLDRLPELSNSNIIDLDRWCSSAEAKAIEGFIRYIQRPRLDAISLVNRLGWLGYQVLKKNLRKPLLVKCFSQDWYQFESMDEIVHSDGDLFEGIQYWEFEDPANEKDSNYWSGIDCRYNHMCVSNHQILGPRVAESLLTGQTLDLRQGYIRGILKSGSIDDPEFCKKELDVGHVEHRLKELEKDYYRPILPWKKRKLLDGIATDSRAPRS